MERGQALEMQCRHDEAAVQARGITSLAVDMFFQDLVRVGILHLGFEAEERWSLGITCGILRLMRSFGPLALQQEVRLVLAYASHVGLNLLCLVLAGIFESRTFVGGLRSLS